MIDHRTYGGQYKSSAMSVFIAIAILSLIAGVCIGGWIVGLSFFFGISTLILLGPGFQAYRVTEEGIFKVSVISSRFVKWSNIRSMYVASRYKGFGSESFNVQTSPWSFESPVFMSSSMEGYDELKQIIIQRAGLVCTTPKWAEVFGMYYDKPKSSNSQ